MTGFSYTPPIPRLTLLFALLGLAWCAYISFPAEVQAPCATSGCELFRDSKIAGLSLWWVGGAFFFVISILCLRGKSFLAAKLLALGIFLDAILLVIMFFTAPCLDCLVVAACMGLCLLSLMLSRDGGIPAKKGYSFLLTLWFGFFLANSVLALNEKLPDYTIGREGSNEIRLFFSPSCPACREAVKTLGGKAKLYPVDEKEGDFDAILRFEELLKDRNLSYEQALQKSLDPLAPTPEISLFKRLELNIQLLRNKAVIFRQGFRALPLIEINGMPGYMPVKDAQTLESETPESNGQHVEAGNPPGMPGEKPPARALGESGRNTLPSNGGSLESIPDFLNGTDNLGQCNQGSAIPCD